MWQIARIKNHATKNFRSNKSACVPALTKITCSFSIWSMNKKSPPRGNDCRCRRPRRSHDQKIGRIVWRQSTVQTSKDEHPQKSGVRLAYIYRPLFTSSPSIMVWCPHCVIASEAKRSRHALLLMTRKRNTAQLSAPYLPSAMVLFGLPRRFAPRKDDVGWSLLCSFTTRASLTVLSCLHLRHRGRLKAARRSRQALLWMMGKQSKSRPSL